MKIKTALFASLVLAAGSAAAADDGFYAGFGIGYGKINVNESKLSNLIRNSEVGQYYDVTNSSVSQGSTPFNLTVGYQFMKYFAVELGYIDLGNASYRSSLVCATEGCGSATGTAKGQWEATGIPFTALGIYPIDDSWSVFARAGVFMGDVKATAKLVNASNGSLVCGPGACARQHVSSNTTEFIGGVGVDYDFLESWKARLEWQAMPSLGNNDTGSGNWNNIQASIFYRF